jgi:soluble lytic murein transglycosylase-like protein
MDKMPWLDSLSEQQSHIANLVIDQAEKQGVDPKLALAIAFQENKLAHGSFQKDKDGKLTFKPTVGTSGEIGLMQVMPTTAEQYGYKREDLQSLEKNL